MYSAEQVTFIDKIAMYVQIECKLRGYPFASPILAQASTESFKGQTLSGLAKKYNNFFGMKCGAYWKGKSVNLSTKEEYTPGAITTIKDNFRVYDSVEEGVKGYFDFISTPRYANLKQATSPEDYIAKIRADAYATSTTYVNTCLTRLRDLNLKKYDDASDNQPRTGNPYTEPTKAVKMNSKGNDVRWLQYELNQRGYKLIVDGIAGNMTIGAVMDFQKKNGLVVDGICGTLTRAALKAL